MREISVSFVLAVFLICVILFWSFCFGCFCGFVSVILVISFWWFCFVVSGFSTCLFSFCHLLVIRQCLKLTKYPSWPYSNLHDTLTPDSGCLNNYLVALKILYNLLWSYRFWQKMPRPIKSKQSVLAGFQSILRPLKAVVKRFLLFDVNDVKRCKMQASLKHCSTRTVITSI